MLDEGTTSITEAVTVFRFYHGGYGSERRWLENLRFEISWEITGMWQREPP